MAEYQGKKWRRSHKVCVSNPYGGVPTIIFNEEDIAEFADTSTASLGEKGAITESFTNPLETFNLINPLDGTVIGTSSYQQVYIMLHSLYTHVATKNRGGV